MRKEYTFSMPESFMKDQSVPARWRVLGIVNGFHISGKEFWGSNEWLMEELSCSEQTVSNAFKELEELGEVSITRTRRSRLVSRKLRDPSQLGSETQVGSVRDPSSFGTISVSNSDKEKGVATAPPFIEVIQDEERPAKRPKAKYADARTAFSWLPNRQESWENDLTQLNCGLLLFRRGEEAVRKFVKYVQFHQDDDGWNYNFTKPSDYERKWEDIKAYAKRNR